MLGGASWGCFCRIRNNQLEADLPVLRGKGNPEIQDPECPFALSPKGHWHNTVRSSRSRNRRPLWRCRTRRGPVIPATTPAHRLYAKRGYDSDGLGVTYKDRSILSSRRQEPDHFGASWARFCRIRNNQLEADLGTRSSAEKKIPEIQDLNRLFRSFAQRALAQHCWFTSRSRNRRPLWRCRDSAWACIPATTPHIDCT